MLIWGDKMIDTRQKICASAIGLFNKKGYENVSLREIAAEAGTSIGNLTYYFHKKDDLLLEILKELEDDYTIGFETEDSKLEPLDALYTTFYKAKRNHIKYNFFFKNMTEITNCSKRLRDMNSNLQKRIYYFHFSIFTKLQKQGVIKDEFSPSQLKSLAFIMVNILSTWSMGGGPLDNEYLEPVGIVETLTELLLPYTNSGRFEPPVNSIDL